MLSSKEFLLLAQELRQLGAFPGELSEGMTIARGYADLGIEEFCLLANGKMVSLLSGKIGELPDGHQQHFFMVPAIPEMVEAIERRGFDIQGLNYKDQRIWQISLRSLESHQNFMVEHPQIECAFAEALKAALQAPSARIVCRT